MDDDVKRVLRRIAESLSWCAFWLFIISMNTCGTAKVRIVSSDPPKAETKEGE